MSGTNPEDGRKPSYKPTIGGSSQFPALSASSSTLPAGSVRNSPQIKPAFPPISEVGSRNSSTLNVQTSGIKNKLKKLKSRPHLKRLNSATPGATKLIFSVDDDIDDEIDEGTREETKKSDRDYIEGYQEALRVILELNKAQSPGYFPEFEEGKDKEVKDVKAPRFEAKDVLKDAKVIKDPKDNTENKDTKDSKFEIVPENDRKILEELDSEDDDSASLKSSTSSLESLNLRERQDAINFSHPFGIKIWKPSLYKKKRSVAARAEEDIHDTHRPTTSGLYWGVLLTNYIWFFTAGIFLFLVCIAGSLVVFIFSGFAIHSHLRPYVKLLYKVGKYWLFPFGKFVLLNKDENYLDEDELDGRSISEFHRWRSQEEGRLFFAPPRRFTATDESRPLMKDHHGRPLRDAYSSLGEREGTSVPESGPKTMEGDDEAPSRTDSYGVDFDDENDVNDIKTRFFGRGSWSSGRIMFYVYFYGILQPILYLVGLICWLVVFTIPMTNISSTICDHLRRHPLALDFEQEKEYYRKDARVTKKPKHQLIILCTYRCCGFHYYKYTIDGTNIFFINLLAAVVFVILDYYVLREKLGWEMWFTDASFLFFACLFSIIPLAYFIGQAVASISAQSSMGVGAVINAFFSTIVEIFLYCVALNQSKGKLVEGSMIGSIIGGVLLLPGLSMCGGALNRKTQRYNPRSAGVSSTMLLFAMVTMLAPSMFYQMYGAYEVKCMNCEVTNIGKHNSFSDDCTKCRFIKPVFVLDKLYFEVIKPFSLIVAFALFAAYVCGLFFTLRTHASLIWATSHEPKKEDSYFRSPSVVSMDNMATPGKLKLPPSAGLVGASGPGSTLGAASGSAPLSSLQSTSDLRSRPGPSRMPSLQSPALELSKKLRDPVLLRSNTLNEEFEETSGGHDAPNWSRNKSTVILLGATLMYAVIAEILVDTVDAVLADFPINPKFLGLIVFALVPNTTEFLNAISFAISGIVALSMEIGSAYALQVVLIQIPSLVLYSMYIGSTNVEQIFSLVFPRWDIIATLISIYLFTYIYAEGKSNYFKGVILILIYFVVMIGFWFNDKIELLDDQYN